MLVLFKEIQVVYEMDSPLQDWRLFTTTITITSNRDRDMEIPVMKVTHTKMLRLFQSSSHAPNIIHTSAKDETIYKKTNQNYQNILYMYKLWN